MKRNIFLTIVLTIILIFSSLCYSDIMKDETVYVKLNHDGSVSDISVVNRVSGNSNEKYFTDYGEYKYIKNLRGNQNPIIEDDKVKWPISLLKNNDIYYEGGLNKKLPIGVQIKYFLNGLEIKGEELAGKDGNLKIRFFIDKNNQGLTTQIQFSLDLDLFSNVKVKNGAYSVIGKKMNIVFTHLPIKEQVYEIEAYGENIELDSIIISSMSAKFLLPEDLNTNMNKIFQDCDKLEYGTKELTNGTKELKNGIVSLNQGISNLSCGYRTTAENLKEISNGFKNFNQGLFEIKDQSIILSQSINSLNGGLSDISRKSIDIKNGFQNLNNEMNTLSKSTKSLNGGLQTLKSNHEDLTSLAKELSSSSNPKVRALAKGVINEDEVLSKISSVANQVDIGTIGITNGYQKLYTGYEKYHEGQSIIVEGMNELNEKIEYLPKEFNKMYEAHNQLVKGFSKLDNGIQNLNNGLNEVKINTKVMPTKIDELVNAQVEVSNGVSKLNNEGIKKAEKLIEPFENSKFSSFVNNDKNKNSTIQFVMKTPNIKVKLKETNEIETSQPKQKRNFFQKIINFLT